MFLQSPIEEISLQTGIHLVHSTFGRCLYEIKTFPYEPGSTIELETFGTANTTTTQIAVPYLIRVIVKSNNRLIRKRKKKSHIDVVVEIPKGATNLVLFYQSQIASLIGIGNSSIINCIVRILVYLLHSVLYEQTVGIKNYVDELSYGRPFLNLVLYKFCTTLFGRSEESVRLQEDFDRAHILVAVITVRALYAGTLVICRTTASSHQKRRSSSALLVALCLVLVTLTIATRCYASKNATHHPLAQLTLQPQPLSSITTEDSKFQTHSSKIVLSRFSRIPFTDTQSDTRVILRKFKSLLSTQSFKIINITDLNAIYRKRRELVTSQTKTFNNFQIYDDKQVANDNSALYENEINSGPPTVTEQTYVLNTFHVNRTISRVSYKQAVLKNDKNLEIRGLSNFNPRFRKQFSNAVTSANDSDSAWNTSANNTSVSDTLHIAHQQDDQNLKGSSEETEEDVTAESGIARPMPPALDHSNNTFSSETAILVLVVSAVVLTVALGLVTCVLSHYRGGTAADPHDAGQTPTTAPMLSVVSAGAAAGVGGMDRLRSHGAARELAATRDRQVRLHAVHTDIAINLPPNIALPDGEDHPFNNSRLQIRDTEQESEIYQKCIKPPPNRTVLESESPPPYRSSSAGLLGSIGSSSSGSSDWSGGSAPLVMRCHSMSSTSKRPEAGPSGQKTDFIQRTVKIFTGKKSQPPPAPTLPAVVVPTRSRQTSDQQQNSSGRQKPSV